jgi:hypothetical protein
VKSGNAVFQEYRVLRIYDSFAAERSLALLGSCYGEMCGVQGIKQAFHRVNGYLVVLSVRSFTQSVQSPAFAHRVRKHSTAGTHEKSHADR